MSERDHLLLNSQEIEVFPNERESENETESKSCRKKCSDKLGNPSACSIVKFCIIICLACVGLGLVISLFVPHSPVIRVVKRVLKYIEKIPTATSILLFMAAYFVAMVFMFSSTPFHLAAGFLYGIWLGTMASVISCMCSSIVCFFVGKLLVREWAEKIVQTRPKFKAIDAAIGHQGFFLVTICRMSPIIPLGLSNYIFGVTKVPFLTYVASTFVGLTPVNILYTYLGTLFQNLVDVVDHSASKSDYIILGVGGSLTVLLIVLLFFVTKKAFQKVLKEQQEEGNEDVEGNEA